MSLLHKEDWQAGHIDKVCSNYRERLARFTPGNARSTVSGCVSQALGLIRRAYGIEVLEHDILPLHVLQLASDGSIGYHNDWV